MSFNLSSVKRTKIKLTTHIGVRANIVFLKPILSEKKANIENDSPINIELIKLLTLKQDALILELM